MIDELKTLAEQSSTPYFFVLSRKGLGRACKRKVNVSAVGILNYQGSEENFHKMVEFRAECSAQYRERLNGALVQVGGSPHGLDEPPAAELPVQNESAPSHVLDELSQKLIGLMK